jgi:hypothetical protein
MRLPPARPVGSPFRQETGRPQLDLESQSFRRVHNRLVTPQASDRRNMKIWRLIAVQRWHKDTAVRLGHRECYASDRLGKASPGHVVQQMQSGEMHQRG